MRRLSYTEQRKLEECLAGMSKDVIDKRTLPQLARIASEAIGIELTGTNIAFMLRHLGITKRIGYNGRRTDAERKSPAWNIKCGSWRQWSKNCTGTSSP